MDIETNRVYLLNLLAIITLIPAYYHMPSTQQIQKLGNTLVYLANGVSELNKTKILKLLFLTEEASIRKHGYPFFGFNFELWQFGPVLKEVYADLSNDSVSFLNEYIKKDKYDPSLYVAVKEFNDDEFSDWDLEVLEYIVKFAKNKIAKDLVEITHAKDSLWTKTALKYGVLEDLESQKVATTDYLIDFSLLFEDNEDLKNRYQAAVENLHSVTALKD